MPRTSSLPVKGHQTSKDHNIRGRLHPPCIPCQKKNIYCKFFCFGSWVQAKPFKPSALPPLLPPWTYRPPPSPSVTTLSPLRLPSLTMPSAPPSHSTTLHPLTTLIPLFPAKALVSPPLPPPLSPPPCPPFPRALSNHPRSSPPSPGSPQTFPPTPSRLATCPESRSSGGSAWGRQGKLGRAAVVGRGRAARCFLEGAAGAR